MRHLSLKQKSRMSSAVWSHVSLVIFALVALLATSGLVPTAEAQVRFGGSQPAVLLPPPATPMRGGAEQGQKSPAPDSSTIEMTLRDAGPIGLETTTGTFALSIPSGGTKLMTATAIGPTDGLRVGWARVEIGTSTIYFAHVPVGGGFNTLFTVMNTGAAAASANLILTGQDGTPFGIRVSDTNPRVSFQPGPIESNGPVGGVATFQLTEAGTLRGVAGVLASQPVQAATIPVDNIDSQQQFTGFAVANHNNQAISIRLVTLDENGAIADNLVPSQLTLAPMSQTAIFLHQILPSRATFRGSAVLVGQGGQSFVVVALVQKGSLFTAIPVIPEKAPQVPN